MSITSIPKSPNHRRYHYGFYGINNLYRFGRFSDSGLLLPVPPAKPADRDAKRAQDRNDQAH